MLWAVGSGASGDGTTLQQHSARGMAPVTFQVFQVPNGGGGGGGDSGSSGGQGGATCNCQPPLTYGFSMFR